MLSSSGSLPQKHLSSEVERDCRRMARSDDGWELLLGRRELALRDEREEGSELNESLDELRPSVSN